MYIVIALPLLSGTLALVGTVLKALSMLVGFRFTYWLVLIVWLLLIAVAVIILKLRKE